MIPSRAVLVLLLVAACHDSNRLVSSADLLRPPDDLAAATLDLARTDLAASDDDLATADDDLAASHGDLAIPDDLSVSSSDLTDTIDLSPSDSIVPPDLLQICPSSMSGAGILAAPCLITTCTQLQAIAEAPTFAYRLTNDLDCAAFTFTPCSTFSGDLDGNGKTINGLSITGAGKVAMFLAMTGGAIHDLLLTGVTIVGTNEGDDAATLVASQTGGTIDRVSVTGALIAAFTNSGGLVGSQLGGTISNSHAAVALTIAPSASQQKIGGLVGVVLGGTLSASDASGAVTGRGYLGGLAGVVTAGNLDGLHATGKVTETSAANALTFAGGLVGRSGALVSVSNSYATGDVEVGGSYAGGLIGAANGGTITSCHATGNVKATTAGFQWTGGLVGSSAATISTSHATGNVSGTGQTGGLVGTAATEVSDSYARGVVTSTNTNATGSLLFTGGLIGEAHGGVTRCYATGPVSATGAGIVLAGGLVGFAYAEVAIQLSFATGAVTASSTGSVPKIGGIGGLHTGTVTKSAWFAAPGTSASDCYRDTNDIPTNTGCTKITSGLAYFYNFANAPLASFPAGASAQWSTLCNQLSFPRLTVEGATTTSQCQ